MTLSEIRALLRILIDQPHTAIWSDANLNTVINSSYRDLVNEITRRNPKYFLKSGSVATVAATTTTALPSDCTLINKIVDSNGYTKEYRNSHEFDHSASTTEPEFYDVVGRKIWWSPTPDAVYTYTAYYHYLPSDLSGDSSSPELPPQYHDLIAYSAAVHTRMAKEEALQEYTLLYRSRLDKMLHDINIATTDEPQRVQSFDKYADHE